MKKIISSILIIILSISFFPPIEAAGENYAFNAFIEVNFYNAKGEKLVSDTSSIRNLTDGNIYSVYESPIGTEKGEYVLDLYERYFVNRIYIQELYTGVLGFNIYISNDKNKWDKVYSGKRIGSYGKNIHIPQSRVRYIKLEITKTNNQFNDAIIALSEWQVYNNTDIVYSDLSNWIYTAENKSRHLQSEGLKMHFTDEQRQLLDEAIIDAKSILADLNASQRQIDEARDRLEEIIASYDEMIQPQTDDFEMVRKRYVNNFTGNLLEKTEARLKTINSLYNQTTKNREGMLKSPSSKELWADLIPAKANPAQESSKIGDAFSRLRSMSVAFKQEGNPYYHDSSLLEDIIYGLEFMLDKKYNPETPIYSNWYPWRVSAPAAIGDILLLLKEELSPELKERLQKAVEYYVDQDFHYTWAGANRLYLSASSLKMGAALENPMYIHRAIYSLAQEGKYKDKQNPGGEGNDGYYWDGSYIFHSGFMYNTTYGRDQLTNTSNIINMLTGTIWQIEQSTIDDLAKRIVDGYEATIYKGRTLDVAGGRGLGSGEAYGKTIANSILAISEFLEEPYKSTFQSMVKQFKLDQGLDEAITRDPDIIARGDVTRLKRYPIGDKLIYLAPNHAFALSMFSNRTKTFEAPNGDAMKAWYASSGMTYYFTNSHNQFDRTYWVAVDHYRLPGTTVDRIPRSTTRFEGEMYNPNNWVSSIDYNEKYAAAGMEIANWNSTLQGKKSWFIFDDEIVSIGSDIKGGSETIETTIENRKLSQGEKNQILINGSVFQSDVETTINDVATVHIKGNDDEGDIAFYFPEKADLKAIRETRTQKEADMWLSDSTEEFTADFFTLWYDHGKRPKDAQYAYVTLMNYSEDQLEEYAANPNIEIIANNDSVHAVKHKKLGVTGYNFWTKKEAEAGGVTADGQLNMIVREDDQQIEISMTDPTFSASKPVTVTFDTSIEDILSSSSNVKVLSKSPLKLEVNLKNINGQKVIFNASKEKTALTEEMLSNTETAIIMNVDGHKAITGNIVKTQVQSPFVDEGIVYLPVKWLSQEKGSRYSYSEETGEYQIIANSVLRISQAGELTINGQKLELPYRAVMIKENELFAALPLLEEFYDTTAFYQDGIIVIGTKMPIAESGLDTFINNIKEWLKED